MNVPDNPGPSGIQSNEEWEVRQTVDSRPSRGPATQEEYIEFLAELGVKMWLAAQELRKSA